MIRTCTVARVRSNPWEMIGVCLDGDAESWAVEVEDVLAMVLVVLVAGYAPIV